MSRIVYLNGRYVAQRAAAVNVEDRGYQFADGVYEVFAAVDGRLVDAERHFERLDRSLGELRIRPPCSRRALALIAREVLRRNKVRNGILYLQVTRGVAPRNHAFPSTCEPSVVMTARNSLVPPAQLAEHGVAVITLPDTRWRRNDIKSVSLLANVLCKQAARDAGAFEAWLLDGDGFVTEGTSSNAWIVTAKGQAVTRPPDRSTLAGVTRLAVIDAARELQTQVVERRFSVAEALDAGEAFLTSTTACILPVTSIDGHAIGDGRPGPVTRALQERYADRVRNANAAS